MPRLGLILALIACVAVAVYGVGVLRHVGREAERGDLRVLVGYNPSLMDESGDVVAAWRSVLEEEGVAAQALDLYTLLDLDPAATVAACPALILPDGVCRRLNSSLEPWLDAYLRAGGSLMVVYDAGIKSLKGAYLPRSYLSRFTGVQHVDYTDGGQDSYTTGALRFADAAAARTCQIPPGKLAPDLTVTGYSYGRLRYPVARTRLEADDARVLAWAVTDDNREHPAIVARAYGAGRCLHVNLPLGHLKSHADDLPLRAIARWWLLDEVGLPCLMSAPRGVGGLVLNWHVDGNGDWPYLDDMVARGLFRRDLPASIHVCAGPDLNAPGDGDGFDACGKGRRQLEALAGLGEIGSHGGWTHNLFSAEVLAGRWGATEAGDAVRRNRDCLREIVGRPVAEYSAPDGVHPPHLMTPLLEELGFTCYYTTSDIGSAPNRSFSDGRRLSDLLIAFPVMPLRDVASFGEMDTKHRLDSGEVAAWLDGMLDYCERNRAVRLMYSHPYNLYLYHGDQDYLPAYAAWLDELAARCRDGRLQVRPMREFADFQLRMLATEATWRVADGELRLHLRNPRGLRDLAFSVPAGRWRAPTAPYLRATTGDGRHVVVIEDDAREMDVVLHAR